MVQKIKDPLEIFFNENGSETGNIFDGVAYLQNMARSNKLVKNNGFRVDSFTGLEALEPMMDNFQEDDKYVLVDDTVDGSFTSNGSGFFNRRVFTVLIAAKPKYNDILDKIKKMDLCRMIFRQFLSRFLKDKKNMRYGSSLIYMRTERIRYRELNVYSLSGATGVLFTLAIDEPTNLCYDENQWE